MTTAETIAIIACRLERQGRTAEESYRDAHRWVRENLGMAAEPARSSAHPDWVICPVHGVTHHQDWTCYRCCK